MDLWDDSNLIHSIRNVKSIQIETVDFCNRSCSFCPNSYMDKTPDRLMPRFIFDRILDDLSEVRFDGRIHLYGNAEPLMDERLVEWIQEARQRFPKNHFYISTNGDLLDVRFHVKDLLRAGLNEITVVMYDEKNRSRLQKYSGHPQVLLLEKEELDDIRCWNNRGGNIDVQSTTELDFCPWVFSKMFVCYNGDVIVCCSDFHHEDPLGNVADQHLSEIYLSRGYKNYRVAHFLQKGNTVPLCKKCNRIKGGKEHGGV